MKMKTALAAIVLGLFLQPVWALQAATGSADLATGIRQVEEGDLEAAVITLDGVVRRLAQEKGREKDLATAHLYLAMTHLGLSQWERAKGEMREAWRNDRQLTLDPKKFPPRLIQLYEQTRQEAAAEAAAKPTPAPSPQAAAAKPTPAASPQAVAAGPSPAPAPRPVTPAVASQPAPAKKGGGSKALWIGLGVAAAGGGVAAAAGGGGGASKPATASCNDSAAVTMTNARFETATTTCPAGTTPSLTNTVLVDAVNPRCGSVAIAGSSGTARLTLTVTEQSLTSYPVGTTFTQGFPNAGAGYNATDPTSLPPGAATVRIPTGIGGCVNTGTSPLPGTGGYGQSGGYFVISGKVDIPTAAGSFTLNTSNGWRMSFP